MTKTPETDPFNSFDLSMLRINSFAETEKNVISSLYENFFKQVDNTSVDYSNEVWAFREHVKLGFEEAMSKYPKLINGLGDSVHWLLGQFYETSTFLISRRTDEIHYVKTNIVDIKFRDGTDPISHLSLHRMQDDSFLRYYLNAGKYTMFRVRELPENIDEFGDEKKASELFLVTFAYIIANSVL